MANNQENDRQRQKAELEKNIQQLETTIQQQEDRINHVQSSSFQIIKFLYRLPRRHFHSDRKWQLGALPLKPVDALQSFSLSGHDNLVSLVVIGGKYNRILAERERLCSDLDRQLSLLSLYDDPSSFGNQEAAPPAVDELEQVAAPPAVDELEQVDTILDRFANRVRKFCFWLCIGACVSIAVIMVVACWSIRRDETTSEQSCNINGECFRLCDAKCMNI